MKVFMLTTPDLRLDVKNMFAQRQLFREQRGETLTALCLVEYFAPNPATKFDDAIGDDGEQCGVKRNVGHASGLARQTVIAGAVPDNFFISIKPSNPHIPPKPADYV
jgi:hypothetical protein